MELNKKCANCGGDFKTKRSHARCCSNKCSVIFSVRKKRTLTSEWRACKSCGVKFFAKRSDHLCCSGRCSSLWSKIRKNSGNIFNSIGIEKVVEVEFEIKREISEWIKLIKSRSGYATEVDIYRLVHYYDILWPVKSRDEGIELQQHIELTKKWLKLQKWEEKRKQKEELEI